jgi:hypothetical protein
MSKSFKEWLKNSKNAMKKNRKFAHLLSKETKNPFKKMALILSNEISNFACWLDNVSSNYIQKQYDIMPKYNELWDSVYKKD